MRFIWIIFFQRKINEIFSSWGMRYQVMSEKSVVALKPRSLVFGERVWGGCSEDYTKGFKVFRTNIIFSSKVCIILLSTLDPSLPRFLLLLLLFILFLLSKQQQQQHHHHHHHHHQQKQQQQKQQKQQRRRQQRRRRQQQQQQQQQQQICLLIITFHTNNFFITLFMYVFIYLSIYLLFLHCVTLQASIPVV